MSQRRGSYSFHSAEVCRILALGREYCFALVAVRPERRTIHYLPQGFPSIRSWNTARGED
jgi:hypothetical protein